MHNWPVIRFVDLHCKFRYEKRQIDCGLIDREAVAIAVGGAFMLINLWRNRFTLWSVVDMRGVVEENKQNL